MMDSSVVHVPCVGIVNNQQLVLNSNIFKGAIAVLAISILLYIHLIFTPDETIEQWWDNNIVCSNGILAQIAVNGSQHVFPWLATLVTLVFLGIVLVVLFVQGNALA